VNGLPLGAPLLNNQTDAYLFTTCSFCQRTIQKITQDATLPARNANLTTFALKKPPALPAPPPWFMLPTARASCQMPRIS
jgi:hypothetical protein